MELVVGELAQKALRMQVSSEEAFTEHLREGELPETAQARHEGERIISIRSGGGCKLFFADEEGFVVDISDLEIGEDIDFGFSIVSRDTVSELQLSFTTETDHGTDVYSPSEYAQAEGSFFSMLHDEDFVSATLSRTVEDGTTSGRTEIVCEF